MQIFSAADCLPRLSPPAASPASSAASSRSASVPAGALERVQRAFHHRRARQHVAGHGYVRAVRGSAPRHAVLAGMLRDAAVRVDHVQLPVVPARVLGQQRRRHGVGHLTGTQPRHAVPAHTSD